MLRNRNWGKCSTGKTIAESTALLAVLGALWLSGCGTVVGTTPTQKAALTIAPVSLAFGNVTVGKSSTQIISLTNNSTASLAVNSATVSGSSFSLSGLPSMPFTLSSGQSIALQVGFAPSGTSSVAGSITVASSASNSPNIVGLSGTGISGGGGSGGGGGGGTASALQPLCGAPDDGLTHMPTDWQTKTAPPEGGSYVDGLAKTISAAATGCTVYRVSDSTQDLPETGAAASHCWTSNEYNAVAPAFNANDSYLVLYNPSGKCGTSHYYIKNISNLSSPSMQIDPYHMPPDANGDAGIIWDPAKPDTFYYVNQGNVLKSATITGVNSLSTAAVHTFSEYSSIGVMNYAQRTPVGFTIALMGQQPNTNTLEIFSYDMNASTKVDDVVTPCKQTGQLGPQPDANCLHKLQITADGHLIVDYVNASPAASFQGQMITHGTSQSFIWPGNLAAHHTTGMANDGLTSMYVSVIDPRGQVSSNPCSHNLGIVWMNVASMLGNNVPPAVENCLFSYFWADGGTVSWSGSANTNPWVLASTLDVSTSGVLGPTYFNNNPSYATPTTPCSFGDNNCAAGGLWTTYNNELILIPSDCQGNATGAGCTAGPSTRKAYRIAWCYTRAGEGFWDICKASISADGKFVVFSQTLAYNQTGCPTSIDSTASGAGACPDAYVIGPLF
jgi:hypothetical protein